ncbi:MAG: hypothetical protein V6Z82_06755 [Flavobacteriales bacterium]
MASIVIGMVVGSILGGVASAGTSAAIKAAEGDPGVDEQKRHDLANEKLDKAKDEYNRKRDMLRDWAEKIAKKEKNADVSIRNMDDAIELYAKFHPEGGPLSDLKEPKLSDFYTPPSASNQNTELALMGVSGAAAGALTFYLVEKFL